MIFTDRYYAEKLTEAKSRFDIIQSTGEYDLFESLLLNKKTFNVGGLSFNHVPRPEKWAGKSGGMAITKGSHNITTVQRPNIEWPEAFGDINNTSDGCIIIYNNDFKQAGINSIEIFIARGLRNDKHPLWNLLHEGELNHELEALRKGSVTKSVTQKK